MCLYLLCTELCNALGGILYLALGKRGSWWWIFAHESNCTKFSVTDVAQALRIKQYNRRYKCSCAGYFLDVQTLASEVTEASLSQQRASSCCNWCLDGWWNLGASAVATGKYQWPSVDNTTHDIGKKAPSKTMKFQAFWKPKQKAWWWGREENGKLCDSVASEFISFT